MELEQLLIPPTSSIKQAMNNLERSGAGIILVMDTQGRLIGTITDGDIRRAILDGVDLASPVSALVDHRLPGSSSTPVTAPAGTPRTQLLRTMNELGIRQIPLLEDSGRVVEVALLSDLLEEKELPLTAVVMAGGFGTRLHPYTKETPKPMLLVGDQPLLERIIQRLRDAGIRRVHLTTHYKAELIEEHFGDGRKFGLSIQYLRETEPLGTAGALSLLDEQSEPLIVLNGDIVTQVDFRAMYDFHREHHADMTVAVYEYKHQIPFGVVERVGVKVTGINEKPTIFYFVNAGIYLLNPGICRHVPGGQPYKMTDLVCSAIDHGANVVSFPIHEYWLDVGRPDDYAQAQSDAESHDHLRGSAS